MRWESAAGRCESLSLARGACGRSQGLLGARPGWRRWRERRPRTMTGRGRRNGLWRHFCNICAAKRFTGKWFRLLTSSACTGPRAHPRSTACRHCARSSLQQKLPQRASIQFKRSQPTAPRPLNTSTPQPSIQALSTHSPIPPLNPITPLNHSTTQPLNQALNPKFQL